MTVPTNPNPKRSAGRTTHVIRPNDRVFAPSLRAFVDTEALRTPIDGRHERQTLAFGWLCCERVLTTKGKRYETEEWTRFTDADTCFLALTRHSREHTTLYVYAHNLSYDAALLSLATMAARYDWSVEEYVNGSHLLWVTLRQGTRKLCFIDTLNYFAMSLAALGEGVGFAKMTMPDVGASSEDWDAYCRNDVEVLRFAMHSYYALIVQEDLGGYRKTLASQAFGAWRHRFMHHRVLVLSDPRIEALERSAYHGGRSEVFYDHPRTEPTIALDVNSMYPAMMRDNVFPAAKLERGFGGAITHVETLLSEGCLVATVGIDTDEPCYPCVVDNRVIYPTGQFVTTLSTPELRYALEHRHLRALGQWVLYDPRPLFADYVDTLYRLRMRYKTEGNAAFSYMLKIMLNSLYGKFGQRGYKWLECAYPPVDGAREWTGNCDGGTEPLLHRERMGVLWHRIQDGEAFESFPAIAAHVTAYARMHLWSLITQAGRDNVYYCDTDSLYTNAAGYAALSSELSDTTLGKLKLEGTYDYAHFRAPKDYQLDAKSRVKGVRPKARQLTATSFEHDQFESYDSVLGRGADGEIIVTRQVKRVTRQNHQSVSTASGWRTPVLLSI